MWNVKNALARLEQILFMDLVIMVKENMLFRHILNAVGLVLTVIRALIQIDLVVPLIINNVPVVMNADVYLV